MATLPNRVILSNKEQIKCNLCTQWFTVDSHFAQLHRYSLNACVKCFQQFHHTLTHPQTLEVYEIAFIKTGIFLKANPMATFSKEQQKNIKTILKKEDIQMGVEAYIRPIKQKFSQNCKKLFVETVNFWNLEVEQMTKTQKQMQEQMTKKFQQLREICVHNEEADEKKITQNYQQILNKVTQQTKMQKLKIFLTKYIKSTFNVKIAQESSTNQIKTNLFKTFCDQYKSQSQHNRSQSQQSNFHDNISISIKPPTSVANAYAHKNMKNLKNIRERVTSKPSVDGPSYNQEEKQNHHCISNNNNNMKKDRNILKSGTKNNIMESNHKNDLKLTTNRKNIITSQNKQYLQRSSKRKFSISYNEPQTCNSTLKRQTSQKTFRNSNIKQPKTPKPFYLEPDGMSEYQSAYNFDENRELVSKLLKEKDSFQTYCFKNVTEKCMNKEGNNQNLNSSRVTSSLSIPLTNIVNKASSNNSKRTYGEKPLIQKVIQLKKHTSMTENSCQLINADLAEINGNIGCLMKILQKQWDQNYSPSAFSSSSFSKVSILKMVKLNLHDSQFDSLLHWMEGKTNLQVLVLTNNMLGQATVQGLLQFFRRNHQMQGEENREKYKLKDIYLGNNFIKQSKVKKQVQELRRTYGLNIYF